MSITVLGFDGNPFDQNSLWAGGDRFVEAIMKLKLSGSYVTGGDSLDLSNGGGTPTSPTAFPPAVVRGASTFDIEAHGSAGSWSSFGGYYQIVAPNADSPLTFADLQNMKLKIFQAGGSELGAGAYPTSQTTPGSPLTDTIIIKVVYAR